MFVDEVKAESQPGPLCPRLCKGWAQEQLLSKEMNKRAVSTSRTYTGSPCSRHGPLPPGPAAGPP